MHTCTHTLMYIHTRWCTHTHTHTRTLSHTYMRTHTHTSTLAPVDNEHPADMHTQSHKVPVSLAPSWLPPAAEAFVFPALPFPSLPLLATASPAPGEFCPAETQLQSWGGSRLNYCADRHLPFPRRFILFRLCRAFLVFDVSLWQHYCTAKAWQLNHCADRDPPFPQSFDFWYLWRAFFGFWRLFDNIIAPWKHDL